MAPIISPTKKREYLSFSSITTYKKCPSLFAHQYISETPVRDTVQQPLILGSLAHTLIEHRLRDALPVEDALALSISTWLEENCGVKAAETDLEMWQGKGLHPDVIMTYALDVGELLLRAAPNYLKPDKIRKTDGQPIKDPLNRRYQAKAWKEAYHDLGADELRMQIENIAVGQNPDFRQFSLADTAAWAVFMAKNFTRLKGSATLEVEWEIGTHVDRIFKLGEYPVKAAIDWIFEYEGGEDNGIVICDHKTGKKKLEDREILTHTQLNFYALVYYELTNTLPEFLAISQPYFGAVKLVPFDIDIAYEVLKNLQALAACIDRDSESNLWLKHHPDDYGSPCIKRDWESGVLTYHCPFLGHCWPEYTDALNQLEQLDIQLQV